MTGSNLPLKSLLIGCGLALALAGCGAKGGLEPPPSATPQTKPASKSGQNVGDIPTLGQKKTKAAPVEVPNQPFFLDFLL